MDLIIDDFLHIKMMTNEKFRKCLFEKLLNNVTPMFDSLNYQSFGLRTYEPSKESQDQPPGKCWQALVVDTCYEVSKFINPTSKRYYGSIMSDDVREFSDCIIFIDAKTQICSEREGRCELDGFQLRTKDTQSQFSVCLQSSKPKSKKEIPIKEGDFYKMMRHEGETSEVPGFYGKVPKSFNNKPIYCISASCSWYYENGMWKPYSLCVCLIPSEIGPESVPSRKAKDDVRVLIKDKNLYDYHEFITDSQESSRIIKLMKPPKTSRKKKVASELNQQIQDSVQSELTSDEESLQQDQSSQSQQTDQEQFHPEDKMQK